MYHIKEDPREQKSLELILEASYGQLMNGDRSKMNITALCRDAGVARSTFYRLFDEYDDVFRYILDLRFDELTKGYLRHLQENPDDHMSPALWHTRAIERDAKPFIALLRLGNVQLMIDATLKSWRKYAGDLFPSMDPDSREFQFFVYTRSYCLIGAVQAWLKGGRKESAEELAAIMEKQLRFLN